MSRPPIRRRAIIGCSLIGFGSSASLLVMSAFMSSIPLAVVALTLAAVSAADIWQLLRG